MEKSPDKDFLNEAFTQHDSLKKICKFECRKAKENYFKFNENAVTYSRDITDTLSFKPIINKQIIEDILNKGLERLGRRTWKQAFEEQLKNLETELKITEITLTAILLTGGGSRMKFVEDICKNIFFNAEVKLDSDPELCIARGLSRWGYTHKSLESMQNKISNFIDQDLPNLFKNARGKAIDEIAELLPNHYTEKIVQPCLDEYRQGRI